MKTHLEQYRPLIFIVLGVAFGYFIWGINNNYQGKTAQEWAALEASTQAKLNDICLNDSITSCNPNEEKLMQGVVRNCDQPYTDNLDAYVWHYKNCPSPTPITTNNSVGNNERKMPSWCPSTIQAYENAYKTLNYSQAAINEIIKKNSPECASY